MPPESRVYTLRQTGGAFRRVYALKKTDSWLWENWGTTWPLRCVEETTGAEQAEARTEKGEVRYRFCSADWTPWRALASIKSRWSEMTFQIAVRAVSE